MGAAQNSSLMATYKPLDVSFSHGEGVWLWDTAGRRYLDALSGIAVCGLGHAHPKITEALCLQAGRLLHTSNLYRIAAQEQLAETLTRLAGLRNVFFGNSGAEANEAAIKIARLYGHNNSIETPGIIVMDGSFHGRTLATLSATGNRKVQAGFEPLVRGFVRVPFSDIGAVEAALANSRDVVAILVEPIQGEAGVVIPEPGYLVALRRICDEHDILLMFDEVQCGLCRTGKWFAFMHDNIEPDVMTLAKSLGNGVPIGACLAGPKASGILGAGSHGSTFGGNPLASRVATAVLEVLETNDLETRARDLGAWMLDEFKRRLEGTDEVLEIRGAGLMIGIELSQPCAELVERGVRDGILINVTADSVVRLLPPLVLSDSEAEQIVEKVCTLIGDFIAAP
jgi:acetylornithine aminotransferase